MFYLFSLLFRYILMDLMFQTVFETVYSSIVLCDVIVWQKVSEPKDIFSVAVFPP